MMTRIWRGYNIGPTLRTVTMESCVGIFRDVHNSSVHPNFPLMVNIVGYCLLCICIYCSCADVSVCLYSLESFYVELFSSDSTSVKQYAYINVVQLSIVDMSLTIILSVKFVTLESDRSKSLFSQNACST